MPIPSEQIRGMYRAPAEVQNWVTAFYGRNVYGGPNYRIVWTGARYNWEGGSWTEWSPDDDPILGSERGIKPWRTVCGFAWVPQYSPELKGWTIEKWIPPSYYGSQEAWYKPQSQGGTCIETPDGLLPALGPFPHLGTYDSIGCLIKPPLSLTIDTVKMAIDYSRRVRATGGATPAARAWRRVQEAKAREEKKAKERRQWHKDMIDDLSVSFNPHVGYGGTARSELANVCNRLQIPSHHF